MQIRYLLYGQLLIVAILAALHVTSIANHLYWQFFWLDTLTHALGGVWFGLLVCTIRSLFGYAPTVAWSILGALGIGIVWEVFEVTIGVPREANWVFDTKIDLLMDILGGAIGGFVGKFIVKRTRSSERVV